MCVYVCVCGVTGFAAPHGKALFPLPPGAHNQHGISTYSQLSHHAFQQYQLGAITEGHSLKSDSGLVTGGTLWDVENRVGGYSASPGHEQGSSQAGMSLRSLSELHTEPWTHPCVSMLAISSV